MLMAEMKRSVKDSVFTYLLKQPEYTRQLTWPCTQGIPT